MNPAGIIHTTVDTLVCRLTDRPLPVPDTPAWAHGVAVMPRDTTRQPDTAVVALVILLFVLICFNARHVVRLLGSLKSEIAVTRRRSNVFDDHTASESRTLMLLIAMACTCEAIMLGNSIDRVSLSTMASFSLLAGLTAGLYIFQTIAYSTLGYVFTDNESRQQWLRSYNLAQGLLGIALLLPAVFTLSDQIAPATVIITSSILYLLTRAVFIYKGFRIFYNGLGSLVYFILYLCALEVIPLILVYSAGVALCSAA